MIFYFSGTGNSKWVAEELAAKLNDNIIFIPKAKKEYKLSENEKIGFVFPIYAWSAPKCVFDFIQQVHFENYKNNYTYFVCTCHTQTGKIDSIMKKTLKAYGLDCHAGFFLKMPNNYLLAPFVHTDSEEKQLSLVARAETELKTIINFINNNERIFNVKAGIGSALLSMIGHPLFEKFMTVKGFYVTEACNQCGICEKVCPVNNIRVTTKPIWANRCELCQACLNYCPQQAIQYGHYTKNKKRYAFSKTLLTGNPPSL